MKNSRDGSLYKALFDAAADGIIIINSHGIIQSFSPSSERLFGYSCQEVEGQNVSILMPADDSSKHDAYLKHYVETGEAHIIGQGREVTGKKKNGDVFQMYLSIGQSQNRWGERFFVGICHDLSDYKAVINQLDIVDKRYRSVFDSDGLLIVCIESNGLLSLVNKTFSDEFLVAEQQSRHFLDYVSESSKEGAQCLLSMAENPERKEIKISLSMLSSPRPSEVEWWFRLVEDSEGQHIQGVGIDVTEKVLASNEAFFLKHYDSVTRLPLQEHLMDLVELHYESSQCYCFLTVELIDYDRLCLINSEKQVGETLAQIARVLEETALFSHSCRLFASRFLVVFEVDDDVRKQNLIQLEIQSLQQTLRQEIGSINSDIRCGVTYTSHKEKALDGLVGFVEQANQAIEFAKSKSMFLVVYDEHIRQAQEQKARVRKGLLRAITEGELTIHFQPKVNLKTRAIVGFEALLRWFSPVCGMVPPLEIIETAQELNLMQELDVYVINKTLMIMSMYPDVFSAQTPVSINISARSFSKPFVIERLVGGCREKGVDPSSVEVEVTEDAIISIGEAVKTNSQLLKAAGIKICLDDFGTGYSALSYLGKLHLDNLKIDQSFVKEVNQKNGFLMLQAIMSIAKAYHFTVTAEGIETEEQGEKLAELGCDYGQGFLYSKALTAETLVEWLQDYENLMTA